MAREMHAKPAHQQAEVEQPHCAGALPDDGQICLLRHVINAAAALTEDLPAEWVIAVAVHWQ